jgi:rRNA pseudouridine-1189 N-methylase Emg1 (Nep1/Mra1 family)
MLFLTLPMASVGNIIHIAPQEGYDFDDLVEKLLATLCATHQLMEELTVTDEQDAVTVTCGKRVVRYHENGRVVHRYQFAETLEQRASGFRV